MFWDTILDQIRNLLSNDISRWMIAATLVAFVATKLLSLASGSSIECRQELRICIGLFSVLVATFYLP
jgi:hypothetical protein